MPSWNIHTAHAERLFADYDAEGLGIGDENAFLFGGYVPDVYVGFMVPDASFRIDYCITHIAEPDAVPVPDADRFWDRYIARRLPSSPAGASLALGAWAHLVADGVYNGRFQSFRLERGLPADDELRTRKQADFDLFGRSTGISRIVKVTPALVEAAESFRPYRIAADDVALAVDVANAIVRAASGGELHGDARYQLLGSEWMGETFALCHEFLVSWLCAWRELAGADGLCLSADIRVRAGL